MLPNLKSTVAGLALGVTVLGAAAPASAQRWRHRDDHAGRVAAGVGGLVVGAGLVAAAHADRDRWYRDNSRDPGYDDTYYRGHGYYPTDGYYASRYNGYGNCTVENRYDSATGQPVQLRTCY